MKKLLLCLCVLVSHSFADVGSVPYNQHTNVTQSKQPTKLQSYMDIKVKIYNDSSLPMNAYEAYASYWDVAYAYNIGPNTVPMMDQHTEVIPSHSNMSLYAHSNNNWTNGIFALALQSSVLKNRSGKVGFRLTNVSTTSLPTDFYNWDPSASSPSKLTLDFNNYDPNKCIAVIINDDHYVVVPNLDKNSCDPTPSLSSGVGVYTIY